MLHFPATEPFDLFTRRLLFDISQGGYGDIELGGTGALHDVARDLNWDFWSREGVLALAQRPDAARATVLLLYWRGCAGYYAQYASRDDVPEFNLDGYDFIVALEQLFPTKPDLGDGIGFDPRNEKGTDWTRVYADEPQRRATPAHMLVAVPGRPRPPLKHLDWDGRPPTAAERATIAAGTARGRALLPGLAADARGREVILAVAAATTRGGLATADEEALAWLWLEALGWRWQCAENPTDGVLFGVERDAVSLVVPDIVRATRRAGVDPARTVDAFDLLVQPRSSETDDRIRDLVQREFPFAHVDPMGTDYVP